MKLSQTAAGIVWQSALKAACRPWALTTSLLAPLPALMLRGIAGAQYRTGITPDADVKRRVLESIILETATELTTDDTDSKDPEGWNNRCARTPSPNG
jgi:hypothetical protein